MSSDRAEKIRSLDTASQKFDIGYQIVTWDFVSKQEEAFPLLAQAGYKWYEGFIRHSLGHPMSRHFRTYGGWPPIIFAGNNQEFLSRGFYPEFQTDIDLFRRLATFGRAQESFGLRTISLFFAVTFVNPMIWPYERDMMQVVARFLKGLEAPYMVISGGPLSDGKPHTKEENKSFARKIEEIGAFTRELGVTTLFHPNLHSFVETKQHLDELWDVIDKDLVGICMDTAHFYATGSDPNEILRDYLEWTDIIHLKDCKAGAADVTGWESHLTFCELGEGVLDIPEMIRLLLDNGYDRLVVLEIDRTEKTPEESFRVNTEYITQELGLKLNP